MNDIVYNCNIRYAGYLICHPVKGSLDLQKDRDPQVENRCIICFMENKV